VEGVLPCLRSLQRGTHARVEVHDFDLISSALAVAMATRVDSCPGRASCSQPRVPILRHRATTRAPHCSFACRPWCEWRACVARRSIDWSRRTSSRRRCALV